MDDFKDKFRIEELQIKKLNYWTVSLRPHQVTIGSLILSLNRKCPHLGDITEKEGQELSEAFKMVEKMLQVTFKPDKINYLALMMIDNHVHFHIIPRYHKLVIFNDQNYKDRDWPRPPLIEYNLNISDATLIEIKKFLVEYK